MPQQPSIGRIVHYQARGSADGKFAPEPRAAIVTAVPELLSEQPNTGPEDYVKAADLCVVNPSGMFFDREVPYAETPTPGHWSWPPKI